MSEEEKPKRSVLSYKRLYQDALKLSKQKDADIAKLQKDVADVQSKQISQSATDKGRIIELEDESKTKDKEIETLESDKSNLEEKNDTLSEQVRNKELTRFAQAYADQEVEYKSQQDLWFKLSLWGTGLLAVSVLLSIFGPHIFDKIHWYTEPGFYLLNVVFLTLFIYALKQHAHFGNLRIDYANRKTLAQSYQYIIEDEEETSEVRKKFLERSAEIFSSKAIPRSSDVTIYEAIIAKFMGSKQ